MKKYLYIVALVVPCLLQAAVRGAVNQAESGPIRSIQANYLPAGFSGADTAVQYPAVQYPIDPMPEQAGYISNIKRKPATSTSATGLFNE